MTQPSALVVRAPGTNCDEETAYAFERAGATVERLHINEIVSRPDQLDRFQILCIAGGFSYGDDIAAGRILASQMSSQLGEPLNRFRDQGKLILGICNGFQVLMKSGLLVPESERGFDATLTWNSSGQYEDRWVYLKPGETNCEFLRGTEHLYLPVAHAEGRFVVRSEAVLQQLTRAGQVALRYAEQKEEDAGNGILPFPANPNGSMGNIAGLCDPSGRVFGLMPHPERFIERTQHPCWTRLPDDLPADGSLIFRNAVEYFREN